MTFASDSNRSCRSAQFLNAVYSTTVSRDSATFRSERHPQNAHRSTIRGASGISRENMDLHWQNIPVGMVVSRDGARKRGKTQHENALSPTLSTPSGIASDTGPALMNASVPISLTASGMFTVLREPQLKNACLSIVRRFSPSSTSARDVQDANAYCRMARTDDGTLIAPRDEHRLNARGPTSSRPSHSSTSSSFWREKKADAGIDVTEGSTRTLTTSSGTSPPPSPVYTYIAAMAAMVLLLWMWSSEEVERLLSSSEEEEEEDEDEVILLESSLLSIIAVHSMKLQGMDNRENRILGTEDDDFVHAVVFLPSEDAMMRGLWKCLCLHQREGWLERL